MFKLTDWKFKQR